MTLPPSISQMPSNEKIKKKKRNQANYINLSPTTTTTTAEAFSRISTTFPITTTTIQMSLSPPSPRTGRSRSDSVSSNASSSSTTTTTATPSLLNPSSINHSSSSTGRKKKSSRSGSTTTTRKTSSSNIHPTNSHHHQPNRNSSVATASHEFSTVAESKSKNREGVDSQHYETFSNMKFHNMDEVQPLLDQVEMEMNQLRMTRTQFKLSCNLVFNIMVFILNMVFLCLLSCVLAYVLSPIYVNHDIHEFQVGGANSVDSSNGIIPFSAVSIDGNGHVYQGFGMGFSYSSVQTNYSQSWTGQFRTVSFYPNFDSILVVRPEYDMETKRVILSSWILNGGKQHVQSNYNFTNMKFIPTLIDQVFIHCIHHVVTAEMQQTVTMLHVKNSETNELFLYVLIGHVESQTSHSFVLDPILIYNYTLPSLNAEVWSHERILASSSMAIILGNDSQKKQVGIVSHRFDDHTCRYYLMDVPETTLSFHITTSSSNHSHEVEISQLTLQGISCYSVDITTLHMETESTSNSMKLQKHLKLINDDKNDSLQTFSLIATESMAILLNGIEMESTQPIPTCRKGYQFSELSNGYRPDLDIQVRSILGGKFIFSCLNDHDGSVSMLYGQIIFNNLKNNFDIVTGTSFSTVIPGRVTNTWLVHSTKNVFESGVREYDVFLTYEYLEEMKSMTTIQTRSSSEPFQTLSELRSFYTIKCTTPTQRTLSHDEYPVCSTPFKHLSFSSQTIQYDISSISKFGVLFTTLSSSNLSPTKRNGLAMSEHPQQQQEQHSKDNKYFILSTELANWQGGYKWIGICISSGVSFGSVKVAQRGLVTFSNMQQELIEGSSYYANIDGSITRKTTPWYIGYALTKKQLYIDSSFVK